MLLEQGIEQVHCEAYPLQAVIDRDFVDAATRSLAGVTDVSVPVGLAVGPRRSYESDAF